MKAKKLFDMNLAVFQSKIDCEWTSTLEDAGCHFLVSKGIKMFDKQLQTWCTRWREVKD
jgi:hypothetical protein